MAEPTRPDPDLLLNLIQKDKTVTHRGRLKIFFGACAGVGKTYAMLSEAKRLQQEGIDVVIGVVETHGRPETEALKDGFQVLEQKELLYRSVTLYEFDLETALSRNPALILMDELAHTNAPSSRHLKRWQDVEELLTQGIDVYTTLNVQHLESVNDIVVRLTGILVKETVPDRLFDEANEVALIDLPSEALLKRLGEGKVYRGEGASKRASENFFRKKNLIALREIALRRMAERVDAENAILTASQGKRETQVGSKILVCFGHDAFSSRVIRHGSRLSTRLKASWSGVYVETTRHTKLNRQGRILLEENMRLAEKMEGDLVTLQGNNAADEILSYALDHGITHIVAGHRPQKRRIRFFFGSLAEDLIKKAQGIEIIIITDDAPPSGTWPIGWSFQGHLGKNVKAILVLTFCTMIGLPFQGHTDVNNLTMIYLTGIVIIAAWWGISAAVMGSFLSIMLFNFFFTEPRYTFSWIDPDYYFTFVVMLVTSLIVGSLASKLSFQATQARKRVYETNLFYQLTRQLASLQDIKPIVKNITHHLGMAFDSEVLLFFQRDKNQLYSLPEGSPITLKEEMVAHWVMVNHQMAGRQTDTLPSADGLYLPIRVEDKTLGVLGVLPHKASRMFLMPEIQQLETFANLIASSLERVQQTEEAQKAKLDSESEKMKNVLLSSVSHDLRTPLSSIIGASSSALMTHEDLSPVLKETLVSIRGQAEHLAKLVTNLLDITVLESGKLRLNQQPYFMDEVIGSALGRVHSLKGHRTLDIKLEEALPLINMDGILIEQVLVNLLENAIRYTLDTGWIQIDVRLHCDNSLQVSVSDNGQGIQKGDETRIFEKFYTQGSKKEGNAGLGLAICKGIIEAHHGKIQGLNNPQGGATLRFWLPNIQSVMESYD